MSKISFKPIGIIHTIFQTIENMPIQPMGAKGVKAKIVLQDEFASGLKDLEEFTHLILVYHFHEVKGYKLRVTPFMDQEERGLFATRAPRRPNAIGISIVQLLEIKDNVLYIEDADMLDGTPLLDIKPFFAEFDNRENTSSGWLDRKWEEKNRNLKSDERFK
ncbi:tRNA (N6-threonylcarbamoyladenosine(37)-N6)-methyltransferase TrmO [Ancylomarina longa]|uniref:tRNA (N6-threonylcarbamoyladenosine(37)-N6)-methyltransferase TrmO n=1 Tax=Ancylomarina longa TaxID=2487017 RepID=A0A434AU21_9BACT|nr:tRNA (N6-threonylcarbamoyladenosine(37)-N6)-methyltransferase TrmO [Ancylomarina longa]RUT77915.1 tRNA (N6-threonylcarbamoyladenosine(37)-N6)-methyltransferase TrmO [Ancylomarina longa]